ncbi:MAG: hypothetical protein QM743_09725 [Chitinophagaceae bacterium]
MGYRIDLRIGNNGTFYYPKLDLVATTMLLDDINELSKASEEDREAIMTLRKNLNQYRQEELRKKTIEIDYALQIENLDSWDLSEVINNLKKTRIENDLNYKNLNIF